MAATAADLADLVLPTACAGCGGPEVRLRGGLCPRCVEVLVRLSPGSTRPCPAPAGLPAVLALGPYQGVLRETLLAYKERGRYQLAGPLGALLAEVVALAVPAGPLLLVPVPSSARAARARHGDHLVRLARHTASRLRVAGRPVLLARPLQALPQADSAGLSSAERAALARLRFRPLAGRITRLRRVGGAGVPVVVLDDLVTTGSTLAAVADTLRRAGLPVSAAAVLAATQRRVPASVRRPPERTR